MNSSTSFRCRLRIQHPVIAPLVVSGIVGALTVGGPAQRVRAQEPSPFSADRFKAHVTFLADDTLEGREAGTRGHEIAARYVASQLALLGVRPGGDNGTYFQQAEFLEAARASPLPTFTVRTPKGVHRLEHGKTVIVRGTINGGETKADAPVVFVGYGMEDATVGFHDYEGLDVQGKVALVLMGAPKGMDSEIGAHLGVQQQVRTAVGRGAAAVVFAMTRATAAAFPWEQALQSANEPATTWVQKDGRPFDATGGVKLYAIVEPMTAGSLFDGEARTLDAILDEADQTGGRPHGFAMKGTATLRATTTTRRFSSPEVIGVIEGADPVLKNEYVALMAHADHIGVKKEGAGDRINNGALDNAAGVATLLEVARAIMTAPSRPRRSVLIVANTAEEKGLLGAEYFAHYPTVPIAQITAAIDLDMPMLLYDFTDAVAYGAGHSTLEGAFERAGAAMNVKLAPDPMPDTAVFVRSDHYAMVKVGVPAVMLATGMANGGEAAWGKFLSTNYHQPSDDLAQPILWNAGAKFAELNYRVVRELADADQRAQWYANDYFGNLFAPSAPKVAKPAR